MVREGRASRLCDDCRLLGRRADVMVLPEHKEWWRLQVVTGSVTASGEVVTWEWINEIAFLMEME